MRSTDTLGNGGIALGNRSTTSGYRRIPTGNMIVPPCKCVQCPPQSNGLKGHQSVSPGYRPGEMKIWVYGRGAGVVCTEARIVNAAKGGVEKNGEKNLFFFVLIKIFCYFCSIIMLLATRAR